MTYSYMYLSLDYDRMILLPHDRYITQSTSIRYTTSIFFVQQKGTRSVPFQLSPDQQQ